MRTSTNSEIQRPTNDLASDTSALREDYVSKQDEIARLVMLNFPGWRCWFGSMTEAWWSLPPPGHDYKSLIEAPTPHELVIRMRDIQTPSDESGTSAETTPATTERS
jgi:hypothetical protein